MTEDHFAKAVRFPVQYVAACECKDTQGRLPQDTELTLCGAVRGNADEYERADIKMVPPRGLEPLSPG
jgi:hypothetical protein